MNNQIKVNENSGRAIASVLKDLSKELETDTSSMLQDLQRLHDYFKDAGYEVHSANISPTLKSMGETCVSLDTMAKAIEDYVNRLFS